MIIGAWRSLVAHLHGVQGVGGSNPLAPILHRRLMFNYFPPMWCLFYMLLLSIIFTLLLDSRVVEFEDVVN